MQRRLYRSKDNRMLDGVCAGLGDYFEVDPTLVRVGFIVLLFFNGIGLIAYIILALIVPREPVPAGSVGQPLKESANESAQTAENLGERMEQVLNARPAESTPRPADHSVAPRTLLGGVLVILGAILLLRNLNIWWMIPHMWLWPAVFIFCGLVIIVLGMRRNHD